MLLVRGSDCKKPYVSYFPEVRLQTALFFPGTLCLVFLVIWQFFVFDSPRQHPRISAVERDYIEDLIGRQTHVQVTFLFTPEKVKK